jgi:phenylacetate-coenzyme A ligase PaaK-like adenylate-forming protein
MLADLIAANRKQHDPAIAKMVSAAAARVPAFAARLAAAGLDPTAVRSSGDVSRLPVLTKDQLLAAQRAAPPLGGAVDPDAVLRKLFCSPGPIYEPQLAGPDPWRWAQALRATGIGPGDRVLNCFSYHFSPAGAMLEEGCLAVGATVIPAGVGNHDLQVQVAADVAATAYVGLPSYLKALVDKAAERGLPWTIRRALVTAEPLPDSLRSRLETDVPVVLQAYGTAEAGLLGFETAPRSGLRVPDDVLVEVCDLDSGAPRLDDGIGQVVATLFEPALPLVRFGTGDLSAWTVGSDQSLRLAGVLGRLGEAVKVRGLFLHPRQAAAALHRIAGVSGFRFVVSRVDHQDSLRCEIVAETGYDPAVLAASVRDQIRAALRLAADVVCVADLPAGSAIVDERDWK